MQTLDSAILKQLTKTNDTSHKGQNGRVLVIAGSQKYHGAMLLCIQAVSRIVDMVYVSTTENNWPLIDALKSDITTFISVKPGELEKTIQLVDSIIIGPGMETTNGAGEEIIEENREFVHDLLKKHPDKKFVVDATALWHVNPDCLHENCIVTPHSREFEEVFKMPPSAEATQTAANSFGGVVVLKGKSDFISDGKKLYENTTGNVGMTKGGTGDVLAGLIGALAATNDNLTAALAGTYLNGLAGDRLYEKVGTFYNAEDLVGAVGEVWKKIRI
ncbi:MAG: NAD(P)H-hydrate dehydratase [Candidatus Magasanikbacteria bacterium CG_4_9_14_0_2_um_filter_42_11]|uniref:ADP-dependent (S)-NAD(P)H-hydrate dehydratase n=1 Tax=Candidatus Magasanikbacteria bacterium CG_4_9_14_0_2_um_filter_42_11 TaxID=1974643 RepID=A0A2M8FAH6_9BACT|nr:MAG: NAD(P)H-hydrate dehydratase [Candidatus Magasanikbacteria bacterium CG10_big_fil_rev_8_21_14_0_10_43_9]PIY92637.1 MAG: NAD(P)H-hydrate dehydratase [Candidatus Magasanikbacteria bacterium CG_4_10_14_0_8_um_filter_42_12]PJC52740.1 MAG: NAD(P)H-hydrate dehydratase [Candidatus Magasanikbacteria bacterium CG_4_9_14_0_2_um_filter_42_11]